MPPAWLSGIVLQLLPKLAPAAARRVAIAVMAAAAVLAIAGGSALWLYAHDRKVVAQHETTRQLGEAKTAIAAEHRATEAGAVRDQALAAASEQTRSELETIHAQDPVAAAAPASRGTRAVAERLPLQR